ncbi:hypothetical protein RclHR1_01680017 [Rhizophagus clarus]|uniref:CCHC-type domain-containing protein n=1 Tax=Rhizophagus clarus TaxID=94130 RepID=A0A2Z6RB43_9GLOM|nr:hypothetical protein RclHR1_01680017 [Rhizophagus clarus]GES83765.1 hypothetical protein GLOIN_2v1847066 [Rhizophagus clarus]
MSSTRKLRSSSSSSNATIKKLTTEKTTAIKAAELEFSITKSTYGLDNGPTSEEIVREILPQTQVKRQRHSTAAPADDNMEEVISLPSNKVQVINQLQQEPELLIIERNDNNNNVTQIDYNQNNEKNTSSFDTQTLGLDNSIHATPMNVDQQSRDIETMTNNNKEIHMIVDPLTEISNENDNTMSNTSTKGKNKELYENNTTTEIEIINLNCNENNLSEEFRAFTLKKFFKNYTDKEIHTCIRDKFAMNENYKFAKSVITKNNGIEIVIISFYNKTARDAIHGTILGNFPAIFWTYEEKELTTIINTELEEIEKHLIKIVDIPKHYTIADIRNIFTPLGQINEIKQLENATSYYDKATRQLLPKRPPPFNSFNIRFNSSRAVSKIWEKNCWSVKIENHTIRILPVDTKCNEYTKRTEASYKITGLFKDTTIEDLEPLVKAIKGKSCTIVPTRHPRQRTKIAYVYLPKEDFSSKPRAFNLTKDRIIYINPSSTPTCNICGHPNHKFAKCPDKDNIKLFCRPRANNIEPKDLKPRSYLTANIKNSVNYNNKQKVVIQNDNHTNRQRSQSRGRSITRFNNRRTNYQSHELSESNINKYNSYSLNYDQPQATTNHLIINQLSKEIDNIKQTIKKNEEKIDQHSKQIQEINQVTTQLTKSLTKITNTLNDILMNQEKIHKIEKTQQKILEAIKNIAINNTTAKYTYNQTNQTSTQNRDNECLLEYPSDSMIDTINSSYQRKRTNSHPNLRDHYIPKIITTNDEETNSQHETSTSANTENIHSQIFHEDTVSVTDTENDQNPNQSSSNQWFLGRMMF